MGKQTLKKFSQVASSRSLSEKFDNQWLEKTLNHSLLLVLLVVSVSVIAGVAFAVYIYWFGIKIPFLGQEIPPAAFRRAVWQPVAVGNDRDAHGCIGSAGYSWCEAKQKCLRVWEEKCEAIATSTVDTSGWQTYRNEQYGFEFRYPSTWKQTGIFSGLGGYANAITFIQSSREAELEKSLIPDSDIGPVVVQGTAIFIKPIADEYLFTNLEKNRALLKISEKFIAGKNVLYILYSEKTDPNKFGGGSTEVYVFRDQGFVIEANYPSAEPAGELKDKLDQILSTFKFTNGVAPVESESEPITAAAALKILQMDKKCGNPSSVAEVKIITDIDSIGEGVPKGTYWKSSVFTPSDPTAPVDNGCFEDCYLEITNKNKVNIYYNSGCV